MIKTTVLYNLVVNTKNEGSYYVGYTSVGGGFNEFNFSRSPIMEIKDINIANHYKDLLLQTISQDGEFMNNNNNFVLIEDEFNHKNIYEVKIQKQRITTAVEFEYID